MNSNNEEDIMIEESLIDDEENENTEEDDLFGNLDENKNSGLSDFNDEEDLFGGGGNEGIPEDDELPF